MIHSNVAWVCDDGNDLRRIGDRIRRRIIKRIRRAVRAAWEAIERGIDQWGKDRTTIDP
jgi:hypothetical protein